MKRFSVTEARLGSSLKNLKRALFVSAFGLLTACGGGDVADEVRREPLSATATATVTATTTQTPVYDRDDLYRFFAIAFGAAPGVTYMGQLLEAAESGMSIKRIVNVFTTKPQFLENYPATLSNDEFAVKLVDMVVGNSAGQSAKSLAASDIKAALDLPDWTRGDVVYAIFNNLANKPANDPSWAGTAKKMASQVAYAKHFTEVMKVDTTDLGTLRAVVSGITQATPTEGDLTSPVQKALGSVTARLTPATNYVVGYAGGTCGSAVTCLVGLDRRVATATFGERGELTSYTDVRDPAEESLKVGTAVVGELGGNADVTWGRWNGGTLDGKYYNQSFKSPRFPLNSFNGFHYAIGNNTAKMPVAGRASYTAIAATDPTPTNTTWNLTTGTVDLAASKAEIDFATGKVGFDFSFTYKSFPPSGITQKYRFNSVGGVTDAASSAFKFTRGVTGITEASPVGGFGLQVSLNGIDRTPTQGNAYVILVPYGEDARYLALLFHDSVKNAGVVIFKRDGAGG